MAPSSEAWVRTLFSLEMGKVIDSPILRAVRAGRIFTTNRNLTDEQLRALAKNGGVAQLCLLDTYINKTPKAASVCDAVEHLDHMIKVAGIDHVGIGTDFDGGGGLQGCKGDNDLINLTIKMIEKGYTEEDLRKIWGGNLLRVMKQVQEAPLFSLKKRR